MIDSFGCTVSAGVHPPDPFHLVADFQRFRNALCICHLLYQPKKKRRLGITSKAALFCCGSERTLHGEAAAEEIGVRPNLVCLWATKRYFAVFAYEFEPSHSLSLKIIITIEIKAINSFNFFVYCCLYIGNPGCVFKVRIHFIHVHVQWIKIFFQKVERVVFFSN